MKSIKITGAGDENSSIKIIDTGMLKSQLEFVNIKQYTNSIDILFIIFQCFSADNPRKVLEYKIQRRKTKTLELYLILDHERIMQGTDEENLNHIKEVFVKGCETFLKPIKDFKWEEFEEQLKQIL
jgi:hypothetical protein